MSDLDELESIADANDIHVNERDRAGRGSKRRRVPRMHAPMRLRTKIIAAQARSAQAKKRKEP